MTSQERVVEQNQKIVNVEAFVQFYQEIMTHIQTRQASQDLFLQGLGTLDRYIAECLSLLVPLIGRVQLPTVQQQQHQQQDLGLSSTTTMAMMDTSDIADSKSQLKSNKTPRNFEVFRDKAIELLNRPGGLKDTEQRIRKANIILHGLMQTFEKLLLQLRSQKQVTLSMVPHAQPSRWATADWTLIEIICYNFGNQSLKDFHEATDIVSDLTAGPRPVFRNFLQDEIARAEGLPDLPAFLRQALILIPGDSIAAGFEPGTGLAKLALHNNQTTKTQPYVKWMQPPYPDPNDTNHTEYFQVIPVHNVQQPQDSRVVDSKDAKRLPVTTVQDIFMRLERFINDPRHNKVRFIVVPGYPTAINAKKKTLLAMQQADVNAMFALGNDPDKALQHKQQLDELMTKLRQTPKHRVHLWDEELLCVDYRRMRRLEKDFKAQERGGRR